MTMHRFRGAAASLLALLLGACIAPAPQSNAAAAQESASAPAAEPAPASPRDAAQLRKPARPPRMSDPLPPQRVPKSLAVDRSCRSDADCTVKDVGSCCGYQPACVNRDSPTDPAAVRAQCQAQGMASVCGFREIAACTCNAGQCEAAGPDTPVAQ
jgi:hypothetical protein